MKIRNDDDETTQKTETATATPTKKTMAAKMKPRS